MIDGMLIKEKEILDDAESKTETSTFQVKTSVGGVMIDVIVTRPKTL